MQLGRRPRHGRADAVRPVRRDAFSRFCIFNCLRSKKQGRYKWHVDIFEESLRSDSRYTVAGFDKIVAGSAGLLAAESVGENKWFSKLTSAHQKTGAIDSPLAFKIHSAFSHPCAGPMFRLPMLVAVFQIIEQACCRSANDCVQVERLYAHYDGGSITQELCNGGILVRNSDGINADERRTQKSRCGRARSGIQLNGSQVGGGRWRSATVICTTCAQD
jgi:hypothetical protein